MKKFFKNISKKSPGKGPPGSPKLNAHASASPTAAVIGYDVKEKDLGKLHKAAWTGDIAKVKQLAKKDASPLDKENRTPLHLACVRGHQDVVQELLEWKAKINVGDNQSKTPLMKAVECGQEDCCVILVDNHADADATDKNGNSCLHFAVLGNHLSIASMLCKAGANINAKNKDGSSPLHLSTKQKNEEMCRVLLKERADVNIEDTNLRTPLMYACQDGCINLVKLLLEYDADPMHKDTKGWTADDCAVIQGHHACSQLITDLTKMKGGSAASTPRTSSLAASNLLAASTDAANNLGLPATDGAEDSGDETVSRASGMGGPGSDSWGDDTDISLAADERKAKAGRVSLAKFVPGSGDEDSSAGANSASRVPSGSQKRDPSPHRTVQNRASLISQTSGDDSSWSVQESPPTQKKSTRVSFKRDEELSEILDISLQDESEDEQQLNLARQHQERQQSGYIPSGASVQKNPLSQERQRALMEELGISDAEDIVSDPDISEISGGNAAPQHRQGGGDSDWDSTVTSDSRHSGRLAHGTLKTFQKGASTEEEEDEDVSSVHAAKDDVQKLFNEPSDWDSTVMEDAKGDSPPPPPLPSSSPPPKDEEEDKDGLVEWDSELEEAVSSRQSRVSKEVEAMMRERRVMAEDTEDELEEFSEDRGNTPLSASLLQETICQSAKFFMDRSPLRPSLARHQKDQVDAKVSHQESDWDSTADAGTPRQRTSNTLIQPLDSDWDSTVDDVTPRQQKQQQQKLQPQAPLSHQDSDWDSTVDAVTPRQQQQQQQPLQHQAPLSHQDSDWDSTVVDVTPRQQQPLPQPQHANLSHQERDWDSSVAMTPRQEQQQQQQQRAHLSHQESDSDSTVEVPTPRQPGSIHQMNQGDESEEVDEEMETEIHSLGDSKSPRGRDVAQDLLSAASEEGSHYVNVSQLMSEQGFLPPPPKQPGQRQVEEEEEEEDDSEWDSEISHPPSEMAPPPPPMAPKNQHPTSLANRSQSAGDQSEEEDRTETISEWEIDHQKRKENKQIESEILTKKQAPQEVAIEKLTKRPSQEERVEGPGGDWRARQMQGGGEPTVLSEHQATLSALQRERAELERQLSDLSDDADEADQFSPESTFSPRTNQALLMGTCSVSAGSETFLDTTLVHGVTAREELNRVTKEAKAQKQEEMRKQAQQGPNSGPAPGRVAPHPSVTLSSSSGLPSPAVPGMSSAPAVGVFTSSAVYSASTSTASQELRTRLQIPSLHSAPPLATVRVPDPLYDEDDSFSSDGMEESPKAYTNSFYREVMGQKQRLNLPLEDDCLSYTDTEMDDSFQQPLPLSADKEVLLSLNSTDSASILKVQEHLREVRHLLDQERNQRQLLETKLRNANKERTDLSKKMEKLNQQRAELEQQKIDMEARIRSLEYQVSEEKETRSNAELLFNKMREQLSRKEESFTNEVEAKQRAELAMRNLQLELRAAKNTIKEMDEELEDAKRMLQHERNARQLAEEVSQETQKLQQSLHKVGRRDAKEPAGQMDHSAEVQALQIELDRQRARYQEENEMISSQLDDLHTKLAEAKQQARLNEEALEHATLQYNVQHSSLRTENNVLSAAFEREKAQREKYETENESLKNRVQTAALEMQKATQARNELERELHREKEHFATELQYKEDKITNAKETLQAVTQKLEATDARLKSVENELHVSNTSLMERTAQLQQQKVEMERMRQGQESMDQSSRLEKEHNAKLLNKIETLQDKVNSAQHEILTLRQQIDVLKSNSSETKAESNDQLNTIVINLRAESERTKLTLEQKNASLADQLAHYKEELRNAQNRCNNAEQDLRRLNTEYNDVIRKLSHAEASSEIAQKSKEQLEHERGSLRMEVERLQEKFHSAHEKSIEAQARVAELLDRLERAENSSVFASQQAASVEIISKSKGELEDVLQKMQMDNARMDTELRHERQRTESLQRDLQDSHRVRSSLEALCSNLKSTQAHLSDKLGPIDGRTSELPGEEETLTRTLVQQEAEESKGLWDYEVRSKSKLGLRLMQLEKEKQESTSGLDQEKRRLKKALDAKRAGDALLQAEKAKTAQLQREIAKLKAYLRAAKKRKIFDLSEEEAREMDALLEEMVQAQGGMSSTEVDLVQRELEAKYRLELNRKLDEVNAYLEEQSRRRSALDQSTQEKETRLMAERRRMEEENTNLRIKYEQAMAQRESADIEKERYKELYENEMKWRIKLWEQLQDVTEKSSSLKSKLAAERQRNKFQNSLNCCSLVSSKDPPLDLGHLDNPISSLVLSGLNRSIAKHLEAAPHDSSPTVVRTREDNMMPGSFSQSNAEYFEVLKKKYCV